MPFQHRGCRKKKSSGFQRKSTLAVPQGVRGCVMRMPSADSGGPLPVILLAIIAINAIIDDMASITIRKLPENTKRRLRIRAARNGRSMEQEARELLEIGLARDDAEPGNLSEAIRRRFAPLGGVDLKIPPRGPIRDPGIR
jgi:plasmid stability protein